MNTKVPAPVQLPKPAAVVDLDSSSAALASASAPFVFVDTVAVYGRTDGITWLTCQAFRHMPVAGQVVVDAVSVAHLRLTPEAAQQLRAALEVLDLKAAETTGPAN